MAQGYTLEQLQGMGAKPAQTGGLTLQQLQSQQNTPSSSPKPNVYDQISQSFQSSKDQMSQAIQESQQGKNPLETGAKFGAGFINAVASPLAPIFQPIGEGINAITNKISDNPMVQNFAMSKTGQNVARGAELTQNLSTIAGTAAGAVEAPKVGGAIKEGFNKLPEPPDGGGGGGIGNELSKVAEDWSRPAKANTSSFAKAKIALDKTPTTPKFLAEQGLNPFTHLEDGKYNTSGSALNLQQTAGKMSYDTLRPSLQMADYNVPKTPITEVLKSSNLKVSKGLNLTAGDVGAVKGMVSREIQALSNKYPDGMSLTNMHDEGITYNQNGGYKPFASAADTNKAIANRAIGSAMKTMVETKAPPEIPVHDFNQYLSKYYKAADYLNSLHGKVAPVTTGQAVARGVAKFGGAALARHLVPGAGELVSSFAGYQLGKALEHAMENLTNPMRDQFLNNLKKTNPEAYTKVAGYIGNRQAEMITTPKLKAGSFIAMPEVDRMKYLGTPAKIPKELQPLAQEAMKYKSAEEFVKAQQPTKGYTTVYHRTNADISGDFVSKENTGEAFVSNKKTGQAEGYGKNVIELKIKNSDLRLDDEFPNGEKHYAVSSKAINEALKTKSQLTDIWNKANKK